MIEYRAERTDDQPRTTASPEHWFSNGLRFMLTAIPLLSLFAVPGFFVVTTYHIELGTLPLFLGRLSTIFLLVITFFTALVLPIMVLVGMVATAWIPLFIFKCLCVHRRTRKRNEFGPFLYETFKHNILDVRGWWGIISMVMSFCLFLYLICLIFCVEDHFHRNEIVAYFLITGFLLLMFLDTCRFEDRTSVIPSLIAAIIGPISLVSIFRDILPSLSRVILMTIGIHGRPDDVVLVDTDTRTRIEAITELFGAQLDDCSMGLDGRTMFRLFVQKQERLPLVVLWDDGSDHSLLGFDVMFERNPAFRFPALLTERSAYITVPSKGLERCIH